jgi:hypothetical protein
LGTHSGVLGFAYPALRLCEALVPGSVPAEVVESCARAAPPRARRIMEGLTPANVQRIERNSISEYFMWTRDIRDIARQILRDLVPPIRSGPGILSVYERRLRRLARGRISR